MTAELRIQYHQGCPEVGISDTWEIRDITNDKTIAWFYQMAHAETYMTMHADLTKARKVMHKLAVQLQDKDIAYSRAMNHAQVEIESLKFDNEWLWMWFKRFLFVPQYTLKKYGDIIKNYPNCPWKGDSE